MRNKMYAGSFATRTDRLPEGPITIPGDPDPTSVPIKLFITGANFPILAGDILSDCS